MTLFTPEKEDFTLLKLEIMSHSNQKNARY